MDTERSRGRQLRADARRNYERLLVEADSAFRERGTDASLEAIARQAGVAIGTLYAHFPSRTALVSDLLHDRNEALFRLGADYLADPCPLRAITSWTREAARHAAAYRGLAAMLAGDAGNEESELHASCLRMADFTDKLTARARDAGAIGPDVTAADVSALISAVAWTAETSTEQAERLLNLALSGMSNPASALAEHGAEGRA
jgi:AcrR family transcriptional regulator